MIDLSLSITRLSVPVPTTPLVIGNDPSGSLWLETIGRPAFTFRKGYAPESRHTPGRVLLSAVMDQADIPCHVYARAASTAALEVIQAEVEEAVAQFLYDVTLTVDGAAKTFQAECTTPLWTEIDPGEVGAHLAHASLVIPVNPPGA